MVDMNVHDGVYGGCVGCEGGFHPEPNVVGSKGSERFYVVYSHGLCVLANTNES